MRDVYIFDTTLRDGEQSAHISLTKDEKLEVARQLAKLGVDIIEAGFPISSKGDFEAVRSIAKEIHGPTICGLARATPGDGNDIHMAWEAIKYSEKPRLHIFIATSPIHMKYKFNMSPEEVLQVAIDSINYAKKIMNGRGEIQFSPEDATRSEPEFLYKIIESSIDNDAKIINIPDTVGYATTREFDSLIRDIQENVPNIDKAILSVHCHDDLGLAVANSLYVVENRGVQQIECTINGIGERAGNAALEEIVAGLQTRKDFYDIRTRIKTKELGKMSKMISRLTGIPVQPNKAIVGRNAFAHSAGIHQDGVSKKVETYEIMKPEDYGWVGESFPLGSLTGRKGVDVRFKRIGYELSENELNEACGIIKDLASQGKEIFDEDLIVIIDEIRKLPAKISLEDFYVNNRYGKGRTKSEARVTLQTVDGRRGAEASSSGPVDALYKAIENALGIKVLLADYRVESVTGGKDALGEVTVRVKYNDKSFVGRGTSIDILKASADAYVSALNKVLYSNSRA